MSLNLKRQGTVLYASVSVALKWFARWLLKDVRKLFLAILFIFLIFCLYFLNFSIICQTPDSNILKMLNGLMDNLRFLRPFLTIFSVISGRCFDDNEKAVCKRKLRFTVEKIFTSTEDRTRSARSVGHHSTH